MRALARPGVLPLIWNRIPYLGTESLGHRVLHGPCHICRESFGTASLPLDVELVEHSVVEEHRREDDLPVSAAQRPHRISLGPLPVVELADKIYLGGVRSPLAEDPVALVVAVHSVVYMVVHALAQRSVDRHPLLEVHYHLMSAVDHLLVRHKPLVVVINHFLLLFRAHMSFVFNSS